MGSPVIKRIVGAFHLSILVEREPREKPASEPAYRGWTFEKSWCEGRKRESWARIGGVRIVELLSCGGSGGGGGVCAEWSRFLLKRKCVKSAGSTGSRRYGCDC